MPQRPHSALAIPSLSHVCCRLQSTLDSRRFHKVYGFWLLLELDHVVTLSSCRALPGTSLGLTEGCPLQPRPHRILDKLMQFAFCSSERPWSLCPLWPPSPRACAKPHLCKGA